MKTMTKTVAPVMPMAGISIKEAENALGLKPNEGYRKIKRGKLRAFRNKQNQLQVTESEIYRYLREEM